MLHNSIKDHALITSTGTDSSTAEKPYDVQLQQDEESEVCYLNVFMGSRQAMVPLLVDTMVAGSAVNYNNRISRTAVSHGTR